MNRRRFLRTSAGALTWSALAYGRQSQPHAKRVGLIGSGWYGKTDLFRLLQIASAAEPIEVVSLCDVDRHMLDEAIEMTASRQASKVIYQSSPATPALSMRSPSKPETNSSDDMP